MQSFTCFSFWPSFLDQLQCSLITPLLAVCENWFCPCYLASAGFVKNHWSGLSVWQDKTISILYKALQDHVWAEWQGSLLHIGDASVFCIRKRSYVFICLQFRLPKGAFTASLYCHNHTGLLMQWSEAPSKYFSEQNGYKRHPALYKESYGEQWWHKSFLWQSHRLTLSFK
jgi:hypothetical protein